MIPKTFTLIPSRYYASAFEFDPSLALLQSLHFSVTHKSLKLTRQSHSRILSLGLSQNSFLATKLIFAYAICQHPYHSRLVFDSLQHKNVFLWNSLINGYAKNRLYNEAFQLFNQMCSSDVLPDDFTLSTLSKVSSELGALFSGKSIHGKSIRIGFVSDTVVANSIMSMYCKCGNFEESRKVFDEMTIRNSGSWNVLIAGYAVSGNCNFREETWEFVKQMQMDEVRPDAYTISSLLPLCDGDKGKWDYGRELHCYIVKNELVLGLDSDVHLGCCLIDMYSRSNKVVVGRRVFDRMKCRNVFSWTAMINGYVENGDSDEALSLFRDMQVIDGIEPNRVSLVSVLPACSSFSGLLSGRQIHGFAVRKELNNEVSLCNALIDMYSKCGSLDSARRVFEDDSLCKDAISWSSMISGYGLHGKGQEAILLYDKMLQAGIRPDMITTVGILSACSRSGLVNEGLNIYSSVINDYGIEPTLEIFACIVDMLGRAGQLDQALDFIKAMPVEPGPSVWGALVSCSIIHGDLEMQELAYRFLIQLEPENPSNYVSISNLYASSRRWDAVAEVRRMMKDKRLRKVPGCSWISINNKTHYFYVADKAHPSSTSIYNMLDDLLLTMNDAICSPHLETST